jgi:hypothetical protein
MTSLQWWIGVLAELILVALLAGLVVRRRYGACVSFTVYLVAVLAPEILISGWPERFHRWDFWIVKETVHNLLKFAIALELAIRTFQAFPGARATARAVVLLVVLLTLAGILAVPVEPAADFPELASQLHPRILNGTIWLFTAIAGVILWYRLPVDPFHKAILIGFVPYLLVFTVAMNALASIGWHIQTLVGYAHPVAYLLLLGYWTHAAWRPQEAPVRAPQAAREAAQPL